MRKFIFLILFFFLASLDSVASVTVTVNGSNHSIPQTNERGWGNAVTAWIQAISQYTLQPTGGSFTLTADADFGASYGLKSSYYSTRSANPSSSGLLRLANTDTIGWRNGANSANLLLDVSSNKIRFNSVELVDLSTAQTLTNKTLTTPIISQISNTGTLTLPTSTDTLVGRATTDTLTNKTISGASNTITNIPLSSAVTGQLPLANGGTNANLTAAAGGLVYSTASALAISSAGSSGQLAVSSGSTVGFSSTVSGATTFSNTTDSSSSSTGALITSGGVGIAKKLYVDGTTNQLGAPPTSTTGYVGFSGNLFANASGTSDTQRALSIGSNTYNSSNGPTRLTSLSGAQITFQARSADTNGAIRFEVNKVADTATTSVTLMGFIDTNGKFTIGQSGGTQEHAVNGDMNLTGGVKLASGSVLLNYYDHGTFTTAVTGYASVNVTCSYARIGRRARVVCPSITGTSNATTFRIPLPAALQSSLAIDQEAIARSCTDNGVANSAPGCLVFVPASGTYIDLRFNYTSGTTWTSSGTKAFPAFNIDYLTQ